MNRISFFHHPARVKRSLAPALFAAGLQLSLVVVPSGSLRADQDDNRAYLPAGFLDVSTVASNGDQNPYGVAFVPDGFPSGKKLSPGDIWCRTSTTRVLRQPAISKELEPRLPK